jgi:hypothetical protein
VPGKKACQIIWRKPAVAAAAGASLVSLVVLVWSFPMLLAPGEILLGFPGDSLSTLQRWENWQASAKYVERPLLNFVGRGLADRVGPVLAYNLLVLVSFPLSAVTAFALCYRIVPYAPSAMVGGVIFALSPFHWAHSLGHLYEAHIQWVPLVALFLLAFAARPRVGSAVGIAVSSALLVTTSFYYGFFTAVVVAPLVIAWCLTLLARRRFRRIILVIVASVGAFFVTLPVTHSYLSWLARQRTSIPLSGDDLFRYSARVGEYLLPGAYSALRRIVAPVTIPGSLHLSNEVEQSLFLGWVPLIMALVGVAGVVAAKSAPGIRKGELVWILAAGAIAALCSGPPVARLGPLTLRLPSYYLSAWIPFFRTYARMAVIVNVALCCAAAAGIALLSRNRRGLTGLAMLLVAVEFTPLPPPRVLRVLPPRGVYSWLADSPGDGVVLEYPIDSRVTPRTSARAYATRFSKRYSIEEIMGFDLRHESRLDTVECKNLSAAGVDWVLLHDRNPDPPLQVYKDRPERGQNLPGVWPAIREHDALTLAAHFPETVLFGLAEAGWPVSLSPDDGIGPWLEGPLPSGRPVIPVSSVSLHSTSRTPTRVDLEFQFVPRKPMDALRVMMADSCIGRFAADDTISVRVNGVEALPDRNLLRIEALDEAGRVLQGNQPVGVILGVRILDQKPTESRGAQ